MVAFKLLLRGRGELRCRSPDGSTEAALFRTRAIGSQVAFRRHAASPLLCMTGWGQPCVLYISTRRKEMIDI